MGVPFPFYYAWLGVERTASPKEIRQAFRAAVKRLPPTGAEERWREVLEAYVVLRDPIARRRYDARCRGRAWSHQLLARLPPQCGPSSRLGLMLWLGLAASSWAIHWVTARGDRAAKPPRRRRRLALPAAAQDRGSTAINLLEAFVGDIRQVLGTQTPPGELARELSALLVKYRSAAARYLRDLEDVPSPMNRPCEANGQRDAVALMAIWGVHKAGDTDGRAALPR